MPDYIQLLESKLSPNQKQALNAMTDVGRARNITVFLTGGAVRDIVSGASVRDLDMTVQANPLKFKKDLEKAGFAITGEHTPSQTLYLRFGNQARLEISAARTESFPKPARPEYHPAGILDDLRRRDFTANAMALSLNEGSWGLLLDPLNGTADIYARQLRLVSNYGFLEDPIRMMRAVRLLSRTGWEMEERTKARYENAKAEGVISAITAVQRGYELEEIAYEEDPLQAMKALEAEGWMGQLSSSWSSRSADVQGIERLHERLVQLLMAGLHPDPSASQFRLLTAKLSPAQMTALKHLFVRTDLVEKAEALDREAKKVLQQMTAKDAAKPSQLWRLLHSVNPDAVLWLFFTAKGAAIQNRFENFFSKWPEARQKIPNAVLQEMRILPDVSGYEELLDKLTFAFMDAELPNEEAVRRFAAPYSPPAPPPPVIVRRSRAVKKVVEPKGSKKGKKSAKKAAEELPGEIGIAASGESQPVSAAPAEQAGVAAPAKTAAVKTAAKGAAVSRESAAVPKKSESAAKPAKTEKAETAKTKPAAAKPETGRPKKIKQSQAATVKPKAAIAKQKAAKPAQASGKPAAKVSGPAHRASLAARPNSKPAKATARSAPKKSANTSAKAPAKPAAKAVSTNKTVAKKSAVTTAKNTGKTKSAKTTAPKGNAGQNSAAKTIAKQKTAAKKKPR